jgi:hypothetical protein
LRKGKGHHSPTENVGGHWVDWVDAGLELARAGNAAEAEELADHLNREFPLDTWRAGA